MSESNFAKNDTSADSCLQLLNMLQVFDSLFPIGAFTLSNGLETMVQKNRITDAKGLEVYCRDYLKILPFNELGAAALVYKILQESGPESGLSESVSEESAYAESVSEESAYAESVSKESAYAESVSEESVSKESAYAESASAESVSAESCLNVYSREGADLLPPQLLELDSLVSASRGPRELRTGSRKLCQRFLKVELRIAEYPLLRRYLQAIQAGEADGSHGIAVGIFAWEQQNHEIGRVLSMFCYSMMSAMVTNCVKLVPLSQMEGQKVLNRLFPSMEEAVRKALCISTEEIGIGGPAFDICSMEHEILYSRMYIS